jgi:hypothetical protein
MQWRILEALGSYLHTGEAYDRGRHDVVHGRNAFPTHRGLHVQIEFERDVWCDQGPSRPSIG